MNESTGPTSTIDGRPIEPLPTLPLLPAVRLEGKQGKYSSKSCVRWLSTIVLSKSKKHLVNSGNTDTGTFLVI